MSHETVAPDVELWALQEQIYYGVSWTLFLLTLYYLFRISK